MFVCLYWLQEFPKKKIAFSAFIHLSKYSPISLNPYVQWLSTNNINNPCQLSVLMSSPPHGKISNCPYNVIIPEANLHRPTPTYSSETFPMFSSVQSLQFHMELFGQCLTRNNSMIEVIIQNNRKMEIMTQKMKFEIDLIKEQLRSEQKPPLRKPIVLDMSQKNDAFLAAKFGNRCYQYSIIAVKSIPKELFKERNFSLIFKLVDSNKTIVANCNPIPISIALFQPNNPEKAITECQRGLPIFKGNQESSLYRGRCQFRKLHIRQVTSHYPNGRLYALLYPKQPSFQYSYQETNEQVKVDYRAIKPYVVINVVVRAKRK